MLPHANADMSDEAYQEALALAQKKASRSKSLNSQSAIALSARTQAQRPYRVGDHWEVAAWAASSPMARMTADPERLQSRAGRLGVFRYEVIEVGAETAVRVTQLESYGLKKADPKVRSLVIHFDSRGMQGKKTYEIEGRSGQARTVAVSAEGIHSAITPIELFPLDLPEVATAEEVTTEATLPDLPEGLRKIADQAGFKWITGETTTYEQDDFFGRGVKASWRTGAPWPTFLKTSNGVAILLNSVNGGSR